MKRLMNRYYIILFGVITLSLIIILLYPRESQAEGSLYIYNGYQPDELAISNDGATLYVEKINGIMIIDKNTMVEIDQIPFPYRFWDLALNPSGEYLYCTYATGGHGTGHLSRIRLSDKYIETIDLSPANIYDLAFNADGSYVYVSGG